MPKRSRPRVNVWTHQLVQPAGFLDIMPAALTGPKAPPAALRKRGNHRARERAGAHQDGD